MTIKFTPDGKLKRDVYHLDATELCDAIDKCVANIRELARLAQDTQAHGIALIARQMLHKLGVKP